jgi:hypothetical protein
MPSQYGRVKNTVKGEGEVQDDIDQDYGFIDDSLKRLSILETSMNLNRRQIMTSGFQNIMYKHVSV